VPATQCLQNALAYFSTTVIYGRKMLTTATPDRRLEWAAGELEGWWRLPGTRVRRKCSRRVERHLQISQRSFTSVIYTSN
jgi:hypothetical protein